MQKILTIALLFSFLIGYLEWADRSAFIFQVAYDILFSKGKAGSFSHPLVLAPFIGQLLLLISLFMKQPPRWLVITGIVLQGIMMFFILLTGILSLNIKIIASTLPFILLAVMRFPKKRKPRINTGHN